MRENLHLLLILLVVLTALGGAIHALLNKRDPRAALGWIVVCLAFPPLGFLAYLLLGINRIRVQAQTLHHRSSLGPPIPAKPLAKKLDPDDRADVRPEDRPAGHPAELPRVLAGIEHISTALSRYPICGGNSVEILHNGEETYPAMWEAIDGARKCVYLATYIFESNATGERFADTLARARGRGVEVRVLLDGYGELYSWPPAGRLLERRGVRVERFLPPLRPQMWHFNLRNHRKILTVDGAIGFVGGINLGDRHLALRTENPARVVDMHFRIAGTVVSQIERVFAEDWEFASGEHLEPSPPAAPVGETLCHALPDGPNQDLDRLAMLLIGAAGSARRQLTIMTPYFLPSREFVAALQTAALRGVEVEVFLPGKNNLPYVHWATRNLLWELLERGVRVYEQPPPFVHTKYLTLDGHYSLIGSFNIDPRSLRLNFELGVEVYGTELAAALDTHTDAVRSTSRQVTLEEVDGRSLPVRLRDGICWLFSPYL